jgi:hypothetical protein
VANKEGAELTTAINLANNIHERAVRIGYDDLFDLEGTYSPAIDSRGSAVTEISGWAQVVDVCYVDENRLTTPVPDTQYEPTARVSVVVTRNNKSVYRTSWIATAPD